MDTNALTSGSNQHSAHVLEFGDKHKLSEDSSASVGVRYFLDIFEPFFPENFLQDY